MRRGLLATTVLAGMTGLAANVQAAEGGPVTLSVGGYMQAFAGWAKQDTGNGPDGLAGTADDAPGTDRRNLGFFREGKIEFSGRTVLDNGLKVGVFVALEAEDCTDQIDESYIWFESHL